MLLKTDFSFDNDIVSTVEILRAGGTILYPTDTVWGLGCDATNPDAVQKIFQIKERNESKSLIILVDSVAMLQQYLSDLPDEILRFISETTQPTTVIYSNPKKLAINAIASDKTAGIRIANDDFCQQLIRAFGKPIISTSANISGQPTARFFNEIDPIIINRCDYVVAHRRDDLTSRSPSALIRYVGNGIFEKLR